MPNAPFACPLSYNNASLNNATRSLRSCVCKRTTTPDRSTPTPGIVIHVTDKEEWIEILARYHLGSTFHIHDMTPQIYPPWPYTPNPFSAMHHTPSRNARLVSNTPSSGAAPAHSYPSSAPSKPHTPSSPPDDYPA